MKSGNYDELMDKFYAGTASAEEISLLKTEGLLDEQDILYAEALKGEREQKMNWEFEDLMRKVTPTKVVAFSGRSMWTKRILVAAAIVAAILTTYIFWPQQPQPNEIANVATITKPVDNNINPSVDATLPVNEIKDTAPLVEKTKTISKRNMDYAMTTSRKSPEKDRIKSEPNEKMNPKADSRDFLVIVNGKPITDEADAIAITRESLSMVSRNLSTTVDELKPIGQIKIKL